MMSLFIRHYAKYLNEKLVFYRHHGTDFCHIKARYAEHYWCHAARWS